jgi:hypothetical protein
MATDTSLFLIGDSNIIAIARAARDQSRVFRGGPVGIGLDLERPFFTVENGDFVLLGTHLDSIRDEFRDLLRHSGPILSTVGFNSHRFAQRLHNFIKLKGGSSWQDLMSQQVFHQTVLDARREALSFYELLQEHNREVYFLHSPMRGPTEYLSAQRSFEAAFISRINETGATIVDIRDHVMGPHGLLAEFAREKDTWHSNKRFGTLALDQMDALRSA